MTFGSKPQTLHKMNVYLTSLLFNSNGIRLSKETHETNWNLKHLKITKVVKNLNVCREVIFSIQIDNLLKCPTTKNVII